MADREPVPLDRARTLEALAAALQSSERMQAPSALFMISVNGLGAINARLGIDVGDELIAATGQLLKSSFPASATIGRFASNTFAVIVEDCEAAGLAAAAHTAMTAVRNARLQTSAGPLAATISVGGVALPEHARSVDDAVAHALDALEQAKRQPTGAFVAHCPHAASQRKARRAAAVSGAVMSALDEGRTLLMLQPVVAAATRRIAFHEGLLRVTCADGALIPTADFIEEAEELGLVHQVDRRALELGIGLLVKHPRLRLAVNISSLTAGDEDWVAVLRTLAAGRADVPQRLIVEVTETAMIHDFDAAAAFFDRLRALGCRIAIDDFGAGYTSLRHLRALNVDMLKIDGALIAKVPGDPRSCALVKSVIDMAGALGLETVAEWVSEEAAAAFLQAAGVTYFQGFLFGQPTRVEELEMRGVL